MTRGMKIGIGFTVVPIIIIMGYLGYNYFFPEVITHTKMAIKSNPSFAFDGGVTPSNPTAQVLVGAGTCFMSVCYGIAKIIREIRRV
jgi:hypothetical protein